MGVGKAYSHPHLLLLSCAPSERMEAVRKRGESSKAFRALRQSLPHAIPAPFTLLLTQTHWVFSSCQTSASSVLSSYIHHMAYHILSHFAPFSPAHSSLQKGKHSCQQNAFHHQNADVTRLGQLIVYTVLALPTNGEVRWLGMLPSILFFSQRQRKQASEINISSISS